MTAVHWSGLSPKSHWASMSSSPLLARVALSTVIFGPIAQLGCFRASAGVACWRPSSGQSRNAPPLAVRMIRLTLELGWPWMHWKTALCSLSTGRIRDPRSLACCHHELAREDQDLLRREGQVLARRDRGEGRFEPRCPDDRHEDEIGGG